VTRLLPVGFGLRLDRATRRSRDGTMLWGGAPWRLLRLTRAGVRVLDTLLATGVVDERDGALARRLVDAGVAHPVPLRRSQPLTVVVPARDRPELLDRCLAAADGLPVVVVDDGSQQPDAVAAVAAAHGATLLRHGVARGPAAARNTGAAVTQTALVAFVDSDCVAHPRSLHRLADHLRDDAVALVAPRVRPVTTSASGALARFASVRSPLDVGDQQARVRPDGRVTYVPSTTIVVRRAALTDVGGFDETLRTGEDVDLCWRLHDAGWTVRYDPSVQVNHEEPATWTAWLDRRRRYGASAGPLARRHPRRLRGPAVAGLVAPIALARAAGSERMPVLAWLSVTSAPALTANALVRWAVPLWWPLPALAVRRHRRAAAVVVLLPALVDWLRRRPRLDPVRYVAATVADDIAYGIGVWSGSIRGRTVAPLLPRVSASRPTSAP
jgi:mycofactocin glycosyltransferase